MAIIDKPSDYFNTKLYTGTGGSSNSVTGVGFQPDWLWLKSRSNTYPHFIYDVVRTNRSALFSNNTNAEDTGASNQMTSFNSDGFTVVDDGGSVGTNASGATFASWNWKANGAGSANTDGSISSTVSANTTSGFSIVSYTGTGSNATIGHGLGVAPAMVIIKDRDTAVNWSVNNQPLCASLGDYTRYLTLDATSAVSGPGNTQYQNAAFTNTVFNVGTNTTTNNNTKNFIAYCFASIKGFSKIGIYTGNGDADGTFVYTGFKVAMIICKNTGAAEDWIIKDNTRDIDNPVDDVLYPNGSYAEDDGATVDFLSNGFKCRTTAANTNQSGNTFIYMAFAENPFVTSTGVPATAR
jgi:hypothetical protein